MGLFKEVRREFIARPPEARNSILYAWPDQNIRLMTQLTCMPDEVAVFIRLGQMQGGKANSPIAGTLGPGTHTLDGASFPFLSMLIDAATGGNFLMANLIFVSNRDFPGIKFGGQLSEVQDPKTGIPVLLQVHGEYIARVTDPSKFLLELAGIKTQYDDDEITRTFSMNFVNALQDVVGGILMQRKVGVLDLGTMAKALKDDVVTQTKDTLDRYGFAIRQFNDFHLTLDPESHEKISKLTETVAYSNLAGGYQQYAAGQAMMSAAENPGQGGGGAMGMGLGAGMGLSMGGLFQGMAAPRAAPPAGPTVTCAKCGATVAAGRFCSGCGAELPAAPQAAAAAGAKFCSGCGSPLAAGAA
ncbi:MAG TPA: SPFH domain-containing protein, partial [Myxococcales bacterium]|nr:SPFH domain-containing protein [Myxococcales bacterium]